ncbi:hypothetical protein BKA93DRAFT_165217 [Sparassis latifolia]
MMFHTLCRETRCIPSHNWHACVSYSVWFVNSSVLQLALHVSGWFPLHCTSPSVCSGARSLFAMFLTAWNLWQNFLMLSFEKKGELNVIPFDDFPEFPLLRTPQPYLPQRRDRRFNLYHPKLPCAPVRYAVPRITLRNGFGLCYSASSFVPQSSPAGYSLTSWDIIVRAWYRSRVYKSSTVDTSAHHLTFPLLIRTRRLCYF